MSENKIYKLHDLLFKELDIGDKFTINNANKVYTKISPIMIDDGDFGGYLYNAVSEKEMHIIGQYTPCIKVV